MVLAVRVHVATTHRREIRKKGDESKVQPEIYLVAPPMPQLTGHWVTNKSLTLHIWGVLSNISLFYIHQHPQIYNEGSVFYWLLHVWISILTLGVSQGSLNLKKTKTFWTILAQIPLLLQQSFCLQPLFRSKLSLCFNKHSHAKNQRVPSTVVCGGLYIQPVCHVTVICGNKEVLFREERTPKVHRLERRNDGGTQNNCWGANLLNRGALISSGAGKYWQ